MFVTTSRVADKSKVTQALQLIVYTPYCVKEGFVFYSGHENGSTNAHSYMYEYNE